MQTALVKFSDLPVGTPFLIIAAFHRKTAQNRAVNYHSGSFYTPKPDALCEVDVRDLTPSMTDES
jgi:hypothetical protein